MIFAIAYESIVMFDYIFAFVYFFKILNYSCGVKNYLILFLFHAYVSNYSWSNDTELLKIQTFMFDLLQSIDMITFSSIAVDSHS